MKEFYSTLLFLLVYFLTKNFVWALFALAIMETLPCFKSVLVNQKISTSTLLKISLLWLSLILTWAFDSPLYFQYKTSLVYVALGCIALWAPAKWKEQIYYESLHAVIDLPAFHQLCPKVARVFMVGSLVNVFSVSYFSLTSWMIFKPFLAIGISMSIFMLAYVQVLRHQAMAAQEAQPKSE